MEEPGWMGASDGRNVTPTSDPYYGGSRKNSIPKSAFSLNLAYNNIIHIIKAIYLGYLSR